MQKPNMSQVKNPTPSQEPVVRAKNFNEVALGYSEEIAIDEALRCLNCKNMPCVSGCPVKIHIPAFIEKVAEGEFEEAYKIITEASSLPATLLSLVLLRTPTPTSQYILAPIKARTSSSMSVTTEAPKLCL